MDVNSFVPMGKRVLVKKWEPEIKKGSLLLPYSAPETPICGLVIKGREDHGWPEGTLVFFAHFSGIKMSFDEVEYILLREDELLGMSHGNA